MHGISYSFTGFYLSTQNVASVQFSCSAVSDSLRPHGLQHARPPCPPPTPRACLNWYRWKCWWATKKKKKKKTLNGMGGKQMRENWVVWTPAEFQMVRRTRTKLTFSQLLDELFLSFPCISVECVFRWASFVAYKAGKESACNARDLGSIPGLGRFPWRRERIPTPVFRPGEFPGLYSSRGCVFRCRKGSFFKSLFIYF